MSDGPGGFFLPFPFQPDEETLRRMREAHEHQEMIVEDYHHGVARLFNGMTQEQLEAQRTLLHVIVANSKGTSRVIPAYYEGIIKGILATRHGVCIGCDNNHDELIKEQTEREARQDTLPAMDGGDPFKPGEPLTDLPVGRAGLLSDAQLENMELYHLDDLRTEDEGILIGFRCIKCGLQYPTIEDRMLKQPDDCHGCQMKDAHG